jgi:uncharacterized damage-inducible protein DinB
LVQFSYFSKFYRQAQPSEVNILARKEAAASCAQYLFLQRTKYTFMRTPVQQLIFQLENTFGGRPWYGNPLMETLENISPETATTLLEDRSILRLARHMLAWRTFVLHKLQGGEVYDIELGSEQDWPSDDRLSWPETLQALRDNQTQLLETLRRFPEEKLLERVPKREYRYAAMLEGLVQHDVYHLGQISLLKKLV